MRRRKEGNAKGRSGGAGRDGGHREWVGGRIHSDEMERLFRNARLLHDLAPWEQFDSEQPLRVDIPDLGLEGGCLVLVGSLGISRGILLFSSLSAFEAFLEASSEMPMGRRPVDFGTGWLALEFVPGAEVPPEVLEEVEAYGWPVDSTDIYPILRQIERDGGIAPPLGTDVRTVSACVGALNGLFARYGHQLGREHVEPFSVSFYDEEDLEVRFTYPFLASGLFEEESSGPRRTRPRRGSVDEKVGRNDPCPCGSGLKYKNCHLREDEGAAAPSPRPNPLHALDIELATQISRYAQVRFGADFEAALETFTGLEGEEQLAGPWSVYGHPVRGRSAASWYLEEHGSRLSERQRGWIEAQQAAWLSVWEVTSVDPGRSLTLRDLLTEEIRIVEEVRASELLHFREAILARIVDFEGTALLAGVHSQPLPPREASEVVRSAEKKFRSKRAMPVERLREPAHGRWMIRRWEEAAQALYDRLAYPTVLHNTDGDLLEPTLDRFEIAPDRRGHIEALLTGWEDVEAPEPQGGETAYIFYRASDPRHPDRRTLIGRAEFSDRDLLLETNSIRRADALRERIISAAGEDLQHIERRHAEFGVDGRGGSGTAGRSSATRAATLSGLPGFSDPGHPEMDEFIKELKRQHYAEWVDEPLPALGGRTPREAAETAEGREAADIVLKEMELLEQRLAENVRFDFSDIRRTLGIR